MSHLSDQENDIIAEYENRDNDALQYSDDEAGERNAEDEEGKEDNEGRRVDPQSSKPRKTRTAISLSTRILKGEKGVHTIEKYFEGFKFHGKGREKEDLDRVMKRLEHWAHRLYPKLDFDDCLARIENLGSKKELSAFIKKYRMDMLTADDDVVRNVDDDNDDNEDRNDNNKDQDQQLNNFDSLFAGNNELNNQVELEKENQIEISTLKEPIQVTSVIDNEVRERIERNRQLALEKRRAALVRKQQNTSNVEVGESQALQCSEDLSSQATENSQLTNTQPSEDSQVTDLQLNEPTQTIDSQVSVSSESITDDMSIKQRIEKNRLLALERREKAKQRKLQEHEGVIEASQSLNSSSLQFQNLDHQQKGNISNEKDLNCEDNNTNEDDNCNKKD